MKNFEFEYAQNFQDAAEAMKNEGTVVLAGGTDLLGSLKDDLLKEYPSTVVTLKKIEGADYIKEENGKVSIGAMARLCDIASNEMLKDKAPALAEAAYSVASPLIRNVATIGGNICQDVRCWFYRYPHHVGDRLDCMRKGGDECYAIRGDNRNHSIFGGMKVHSTPCSMECPAHTDIPGYMAKLRKGDFEGAARILMQANPMPMLTSRVCAHFCQNGCNRQSTDESVAVHSVERCVGDYILENMDKFYAAPEKETGKSVGLVGSGPAGLAAAFYLRKAGHAVTVYDRLEEAGGCLTYAIPAYRLPKHYVKDVVAGLEKMGVKFELNKEMGKDFTAADLEAKFDKVFFATGAWQRPVMGFDGEEFTEFGLKFLMEVNQWVNKKERNNVLVVGGGNVAMDVAVTAKRLGAKSVTLACLEQRHEMPASAEEVGRAEEEGVVVMNGYGVSRLIYEGEKIKGMELRVCTAVRDETGRFNPQYDDSQKVIMEADSVLVAAGQRVDLSFIEEKFELAKQRGLIAVDEATQKTSRPDVFAGGDATTGPATVIKAIRTGRVAAETINSELGVENPEKYKPEGFITYNVEAVKNVHAAKDVELSADQRALDREDSSTISEEACIAEVGRCMNCGCYSVNASDISPVLIALDADIVTTKKVIKAVDFFTTKLKAYDMLDQDELVTEIRFDVPDATSSRYQKFRVRKSIDFAITSLASVSKVEDGVIKDIRLVLGGVAPVPVRREAAEKVLIGQKPSAELAEVAADAALEGASPMKDNAYKLQEVRAMIKELVTSL